MLILDSKNRPYLAPRTEPTRVQVPRGRTGRARQPQLQPLDGRFLGKMPVRKEGADPGTIPGRLAQLAQPVRAAVSEVQVRLEHLLPGSGDDLPADLRERAEPRGLRLGSRVAERLRTAGGLADRVRRLVQPDPQGRVPLERLRSAWACARLEERGAAEAGRSTLTSRSIESALGRLVRDHEIDRDLGLKVRAELRGLFPGPTVERFFALAPLAGDASVELSEALALSSARLAQA